MKKKILKINFMFVNRRICFYSPKKSKIIIFGEINSDYLKKYIFDGIKTSTYNMKPENIYINFSILKLCLKSLGNFNWKLTIKKKI